MRLIFVVFGLLSFCACKKDRSQENKKVKVHHLGNIKVDSIQTNNVSLYSCYNDAVRLKNMSVGENAKPIDDSCMIRKYPLGLDSVGLLSLCSSYQSIENGRINIIELNVNKYRIRQLVIKKLDNGSLLFLFTYRGRCDYNCHGFFLFFDADTPLFYIDCMDWNLNQYAFTGFKNISSISLLSNYKIGHSIVIKDLHLAYYYFVLEKGGASYGYVSMYAHWMEDKRMIIDTLTTIDEIKSCPELPQFNIYAELGKIPLREKALYPLSNRSCLLWDKTPPPMASGGGVVKGGVVK